MLGYIQELISWSDIKEGKLKTGALIQIWRNEETIESARESLDNKLHPSGHAIIFISYLYNENNNRIGMIIRDHNGVFPILFDDELKVGGNWK